MLVIDKETLIKHLCRAYLKPWIYKVKFVRKLKETDLGDKKKRSKYFLGIIFTLNLN